MSLGLLSALPPFHGFREMVTSRCVQPEILCSREYRVSPLTVSGFRYPSPCPRGRLSVYHSDVHLRSTAPSVDFKVLGVTKTNIEVAGWKNETLIGPLMSSNFEHQSLMSSTLPKKQLLNNTRLMSTRTDV